MRKRTIYLIFIFFGLLSSCEYKWIEPNEVNLPQGTVSFSEDVMPVFEENCIQCHSSQSPVLTAEKAYNNLIDKGYVDVDNPRNSELYEKVEEGHPGGSSALNAEELAIILTWIQQGANNNK